MLSIQLPAKQTLVCQDCDVVQTWYFPQLWEIQNKIINTIIDLYSEKEQKQSRGPAEGISKELAGPEWSIPVPGIEASFFQHRKTDNNAFAFLRLEPVLQEAPLKASKASYGVLEAVFWGNWVPFKNLLMWAHKTAVRCGYLIILWVVKTVIWHRIDHNRLPPAWAQYIGCYKKGLRCYFQLTRENTPQSDASETTGCSNFH